MYQSGFWLIGGLEFTTSSLAWFWEWFPRPKILVFTRRKITYEYEFSYSKMKPDDERVKAEKIDHWLLPCGDVVSRVQGF